MQLWKQAKFEFLPNVKSRLQNYGTIFFALKHVLLQGQNIGNNKRQFGKSSTISKNII